MMSRSSVLLFIVFYLCSSSYIAAQGPVEEAAKITADTLQISEKSGWVDYTGKVRLTKGEVTLTADKMSYNTESKTALAEGNVLLVRGIFSTACDRMTYNVEKDTGVAEFVSSYSQSWYAWGSQITRESENEYIIEDGYVTTDPYIEPNWRLQAKKIRLFPGDKIIANNISIYAGKVPIIWLPYYRASLKDKHSPLSIEVGHTDEWGAYVLVAYDLLVRNNLHAIFHLDYRSNNKWAEGVDLVAYLENGGYFKAKGYFADDKDRTIIVDGIEESIEDERSRGDLEGYHPFENAWDIRYEMHKFSDEDFLKDFFRKEYNNDSEPETYISVSKYNPNWIFSIYGKKQINDFYSTTERLPDISMEYANRRVGSSPFYHDGIDSFAYLNEVNKDVAIEEYDAMRFDTYHRISYPRKYMGWLNIVPRVGLRGTYYNDNPEGNTDTRYILDTDVDLFTKIFKIWDYENEAKNIHGVRHVIEPNIHYFYTPTPNIEPDELYQFDKIDRLNYRNVFRLGVRNKIQTKRYNGNWDIIDLNTYVDYYPELEEYDDQVDEHFSDIHFDLEIYPSRNFKIEMDTAIDTYDEEISTFNTQLSYFESDQYGVNFEYRYRVDESNLFATEGYIQLSRDYAAKAYLRYEEETGELEEAEVTVFKDLRTWVGALSYRHRQAEEEGGEDDNQVWLTFHLKALPTSSLLGGN